MEMLSKRKCELCRRKVWGLLWAIVEEERNETILILAFYLYDVHSTTEDTEFLAKNTADCLIELVNHIFFSTFLWRFGEFLTQNQRINGRKSFNKCRRRPLWRRRRADLYRYERTRLFLALQNDELTCDKILYSLSNQLSQ